MPPPLHSADRDHVRLLIGSHHPPAGLLAGAGKGKRDTLRHVVLGLPALSRADSNEVPARKATPPLAADNPAVTQQSGGGRRRRQQFDSPSLNLFAPRRRHLLDALNLALKDYPLDPVRGASDPVLWFTANQGHQAHNQVRPTRYQRWRPVGRGLDCLPHFVAVVGHSGVCGIAPGHTQSRPSPDRLCYTPDDLIRRAERAAAATPDPVRLVAELAKLADDSGADPYLLIGVLIEGAVHTLAKHIPPERQGETTEQLRRLLVERLRVHGLA